MIIVVLDHLIPQLQIDFNLCLGRSHTHIHILYARVMTPKKKDYIETRSTTLKVSYNNKIPFPFNIPPFD